ncbi:predicted protein [Naegleria gruberi]|uniref:Predicted protein n=1 Tax=Naegleria gruberi TaxID=5762 RepID=D2VMJ1_NAEGR|nr:uncharacterized protein NAEGRDRAFT_70154 [Naegleria gruberi]EFC42073.1 predicted protein [Naegleria gruberi]|eukprot:XP_002674817.1 predicted protein [Naegleria gruberi strain NEG-M]
MPTIKLEIVEAHNLMIADITSSDPYVEIQASNDKKILKTKVIKKNLNPVWNEEFIIDLENPKLDTLQFTVKDWDRFSKDDPLGKCKIVNFSNFMMGQTNDLWLNLQDSETDAKLHVVVTPIDFGKCLP